MNKLIIAGIMAISLAGCASFSGVGGQYQATETVELSKRPARFFDDVVSVGEQLGYQHTGGNRSTNSVNLADQPNFGETMIGRAYSVQVMVALKPNGRTIDLLYTAFGGRSTAAVKKSQERIEELKAALRQRLGS